MSKFDGDPDFAEADLRRASDALITLENDLANAEAIEQETPKSPEEEAEVSQRMEILQREIEGLQQDIAEAEDQLRRTVRTLGERGVPELAVLPVP